MNLKELAKCEPEPVPIKLAILFQGQSETLDGVRRVEEITHFPGASEVFARAENSLGYSITKTILEGSDEELKKHIQIATVIATLAVFEAAKKKTNIFDRAAYVAGSSLGQFTAYLSQGVIPFEAGLNLLEERERVTRESHSENPGSMAAIIGPGEKYVEKICEEVGVYISNYNSPSLHLISGTRDRIESAIRIVESLKKGNVSAKILDLPYASHSPLMESTVEPFIKAIKNISFTNPQTPIVLNETGQETISGDEIKNNLPWQLVRPVKLRQSIEYMLDRGVRNFFEFGPGKSVLANLPGRMNKDAKAVFINSAETIQKLDQHA